MRESSLLSLLWAQGVTMSVCITLTKSADPNWVCPALLRSCWVYALGQAEFRIETQPANSYMMVGWRPMWLWCQPQSQLDLWGLGLGFDIILINHISQQQAGAFSGSDHDYVHNIVELRDRISYQNEQCQRILLYDIDTYELTKSSSPI